MNVTPIDNPLDGEHVVAVSPPLRPTVGGDWRRRLNLLTGRALSDLALQTEQMVRGGRLRARGMALSPGVVDGLEIGLENAGGERSQLHIGAGYGLTVDGEDVVLPHDLRLDPLDLQAFLPAGSDVSGEPVRGVTLRTLAELIADGVLLPRVGILLLQPVIGAPAAADDPGDPCADEAQDAAFADRQTVDGCRLLYMPWPVQEIPLPTPSAAWRNELAYALFAAEAAAGFDAVAPWQTAGVPIGLLAYDHSWQPLFVDRYSVVRQGGRPRLRAGTPGYRPFLWQARMQQATDQTAEALLAGLPVAELGQRLHWLAPAGLLPRDALTIRLEDPDDPTDAPSENHFFPPGFHIETIPVPLEQLDLALEASAGLAPFEAGQPDRVRVLVPVPQALYTPDLLKRERISPDFQQAIDSFVVRRGRWLSRRDALREVAATLVTALVGEPPAYPAEDPFALEAAEERHPAIDDNTEPDDPQLAEPELAYGTANSDGGLTVESITALRGYLSQQTPLRADEVAKLDTMGLVEFIADLELRIKQADDHVDLGFLNIQTDIYRVRRFVFEEDTATRLATSPALAEIARADNAAAEREILTNYARNILQIEPKTGLPLAAHATAAGDVQPTGAPTLQPARLDAPFTNLVTSRAIGSGRIFSPSTRTPLVSGSLGGAATELINLQPVVETPTVITPTVTLPATGPAAAGGIQATVFERPIDTSLFLSGKTQVDITAAIVDQSHIVGKTIDNRTATVADRLRQPRAYDAKTAGSANKHDLIVGLQALGINLDDLSVPSLGRVQNSAIQRYAKTLAELTPEDFNAILNDPDKSNADEADVFSDAVLSIESSINILRQVEGRVRAYKNALVRCRQSQGELELSIRQLDSRLKLVEDELAEARHDVSVGSALLAEEEGRLAALNAARQQILAEQVTFLAYHRPRLLDTRRSVATHTLLPMTAAAAVPACLQEVGSVPAEIRQLVDLLRDVPANWFPALEERLGQFGRLTEIQELLVNAKARAQLPVKPPQAAPSAGLGRSISLLVDARQGRVQELRVQTALLDLSSLGRQSWQSARTVAAASVSIADLLAAPKSQSAVTRDSTELVDNIAKVAGCLYESMCGVSPRLRLDWAERLSQYDAPISLHNLSTLPRWGDVGLLERRRMQGLVDWLYGRVNSRSTDAVAFMDDLARVAILLAGHAPVNEIIAGHIADESTVQIGSPVRIIVDITKVHIGMGCVLYDNARQVIGRAVVEDLAAGKAIARLVQAKTPALNLAGGTRVQFARQGSLVGSLFQQG